MLGIHLIDENFSEEFSELPVVYLCHHIYCCEFLVATIFIANPPRVFSGEKLVSRNGKYTQERSQRTPYEQFFGCFSSK